MSVVLVPLPDRDFDVTEVAVPWKILTMAGHHVVFATEHGDEPAADDSHAFVVEDGRYVSARWPGDAYLFARRFLTLLDDAPVTQRDAPIR